MAATAYPKVPSKAWRTLRARAAAAPSTRFTSTAVAAMFGMANAKSAADNIVSPIRRLGLINDEGVLTARGNKWRMDASYPEACQEITDETYPEELSSLTDPDGTPNKTQVLTWFQHQGYGDSNARQMCATYLMIAEKQVPEPPSSDANKKPKSQPSRKVATKLPVNIPTDSRKSDELVDNKEEAELGDEQISSPKARSGPNVHLDIQIHIPADASPDQIEQIFASMAKHLYRS